MGRVYWLTQYAGFDGKWAALRCLSWALYDVHLIYARHCEIGISVW